MPALRFSGISFQEKLLFTKHLAVMIRAGITLTEALDILKEQAVNRSFYKLLKQLLAEVENGQAFSKGLAQHPQVFDQFYLNLIKIGEESGTLEESLEFLATQLSKDYNLRKKVQGALLYPALIFTATVVMGGFIALFILPQLVNFFSAFDTTLPLATRILLFVAVLMRDHGLLLTGGLALTFTGLFLLFKTPAVKPKWHAFLLKAPIFGRLIHFNELARFCRNLGTLLKSGVPISHSLEITGKTLNNAAFQNGLSHLATEVTKGKPLAGAMDDFLEVFPRVVSKMVTVGEKTGKLEEVLLYLGDFYEDEIDDFSKNLTTILEPVLLIAIGLVVGFVALAVISPIYELTGSINR